jgi:hypothetical protein
VLTYFIPYACDRVAVTQKRPFSMKKKEMKPQVRAKSPESRRCFIGGFDARTIMGSDEAGLIGL